MRTQTNKLDFFGENPPLHAQLLASSASLPLYTTDVAIVGLVISEITTC